MKYMDRTRNLLKVIESQQNTIIDLEMKLESYIVRNYKIQNDFNHILAIFNKHIDYDKNNVEDIFMSCDRKLNEIVKLYLKYKHIENESKNNKT